MRDLSGNKFEFWNSQEGLSILKRWSGEGVPESQIAAKIGVHPRTLRDWKRKSPHIKKALIPFRPDVDGQIEDALLKKASGYTVDVTKTYKLKRIEYDAGKKVREFEELAQGVDQVHVPADLSAQIFWLKNRMPDKWRDKPDAGKASLAKLNEALGFFQNESEPERETE